MKAPRPRRVSTVATPVVVVVVAASLAVALLLALGATSGWWSRSEPPSVSDRPPPPDGYFATTAVGTWNRLPGDETCAKRVHRSTWEPRPDNFRPNNRVPARGAVRASFAARPRATQGAYEPRWDRWLLPRVSGQFTGTTDEIIQWAACKWGLSDNVLRAIAARESGWYQGQRYPDGSCVVLHGCGDHFTEVLRGSRAFCREVNRSEPQSGRSHHPQLCPKTFSMVGIMAWQDPSWGRMAGNQNGTLPFSRDSTAFALDYLGAFLRGCYEGWMLWLDNTGNYRPGQLHRCAGVWFGGAWDSSASRGYTARVESALEERPWLLPAWSRLRPPCLPDRGCPLGAP